MFPIFLDLGSTLVQLLLPALTPLQSCYIPIQSSFTKKKNLNHFFNWTTNMNLLRENTYSFEIYMRFRTALSLDSKDKVLSIPSSFLDIKYGKGFSYSNHLTLKIFAKDWNWYDKWNYNKTEKKNIKDTLIYSYSYK